MNFFDAVTTDNEVVTSTDLVRACMDETFNGITIQDKLREVRNQGASQWSAESGKLQACDILRAINLRSSSLHFAPLPSSPILVDARESRL